MKRSMTWIVGIVASLATSLAFANATVTSVSGNVTAQAGSGSARTIKQGDVVKAGETVVSASGSSAVLRFEDGQIASLNQNSRMTVQAYEYNAPAKTGNVFLNLLAGGMRTVTGLIGAGNPSRVQYKAGTTTIGIRGTDTVIATEGDNTVVAVIQGSVVVKIAGSGKEVQLSAPQAIYVKPDGTYVVGPIAEIAAQLPANLQGVVAGLIGGIGDSPAATSAGTSTPGVVTGSSAGGGGSAN